LSEAADGDTVRAVEASEQERIEARAEQVLAEVPDWIWNGTDLPVPVEAIVDSCFDLLVCEKEPHELEAVPGAPALTEGASLSGLFLAGPREIWVNAEEAREWPPRRRFTVAHELGHCVLHEDGQRSLFCRHASVDPRTDAEADAAAQIEEEANFFAAALLMPGKLMRHHYKATGKSFDAMCKVFGSSRAAMGRRMHQAIKPS
jgi:hypothetical protein